MSEFKPMVKMYTDEPSVSLKLKKGGKVHAKHHATHEHHGHKAMHETTGGHMHGAHHAFESEHGKAPKKPSMAERRKSMNPQLYKKGGKVAHKLDGGMMGNAAPAMAGAAPAAPMAAMGRPALAAMAPAARAARALAVRKALTGMKKGGHAGMEKHIAKLEKELHHHEALSADKAHHHKHGGKMHHKADGGAIDKAETKTTIKGNAKKFEKDLVVDGGHHDSHHGTGEIHEGKPGGYKHGGKAHHKHAHKMCAGGKYATGGEIPADTHESKNAGKLKFGETIEDNEGSYLETEMHSAKPDHAHGTKGVHMSNAGGFKHGGRHHKMHHKADGGAIDKIETRNTIEGGNWENRPANSAKHGKVNTKTGEVKEANAGGYRKGGHAKKHYATGGNVVDDGKAVKMPRHFVSQPVANSLQSGTFRKGGKVKKFDGGGSTGTDNPPADVMDQYLTQKAQKEYQNYQQNKGQEKNQPGFLESLWNKMTGSSTPAGSVTKTEKSVTVSPGKKRGGKIESEEKPNLRLVKTHSGPQGHTAKVYKDRDWDEYRVKFYTPEGKHLSKGDHHTDDLQDAHDTAQAEIKRGYKRGGKC